jgi:hypothetical protein
LNWIPAEAGGNLLFLQLIKIYVNDPELSGKYLGTISEDFVKVADTLKEASYQIRKAGFSYPIFSISKESIPVGQLLLAKKEQGLQWNYYASFLNEFTQRDLVGKEREQAFIETYKDPDEFCCLFVVDEAFTSFVFIPYPED